MHQHPDVLSSFARELVANTNTRQFRFSHDTHTDSLPGYVALMANIIATANDQTTNFSVDDGTRLVLALEDNGIDILHKCGGYAKCTTCKVVFENGEPADRTDAESELAEARDLGSARLSCQILADGDMTLQVAMTVTSTDFDDAGDRPQSMITP